MHESAQFLFTIGALLLVGLLASTVARRTMLPRVTLLLFFGIIIGHEGFNFIPQSFSDHFDLVADMTLLMVGFLLEISRGKLTINDLKLQLNNKKRVFKKPAEPYGLYLSNVIY